MSLRTADTSSLIRTGRDGVAAQGSGDHVMGTSTFGFSHRFDDVMDCLRLAWPMSEPSGVRRPGVRVSAVQLDANKIRR